MHEMAITQSIVEICERYADGQRVKTVRVEIGDLSGVVPEAVEFCFSACSVGTLAEDSLLNIERVPGEGLCQQCGQTFAITEIYAPCSSCGSQMVTIIRGEEMRVVEIEVD